MPTPSAAPILAVAPMMSWTDRHCRYFLRLLSPRARLYTEMVTSAAVLRGDRRRLLGFDPSEHPVALQLGGNDPREMAAAARIGAEFGYDEINVNAGCPSDRVQNGAFGACLMAQPDTVAACVRAMRAETAVPVTVKTRIGIDDADSYAFLCDFVESVAEAGCGTFVVHARKALLAGLSPKENRSVPPLDYPRVYRLKREHPELTIVLNGGVTTVEQAIAHLEHVDGVMIGREAYQNPWFLTELERRLGAPPAAVPDSRHAVVREMLPYVQARLAKGTELNSIARHMLNLFSGQPGARRWRRYLSEHAHRGGAGADVLEQALTCLR
ncbi:MAG TPA: tRNA dihydrouridine(20/20a) synthase DusA [Pseudomonadales bacterium]